MRDDTQENRVKVSKGYKITLIFTVLILLALLIVVVAVPSSEYPDQIEDDDGKTEKLTEEKKKQLKIAIVMLVALFGFLITWFSVYLYKKSIIWA